MDQRILMVPVGLDAPRKMFFWDIDVFLIGMLGFGIGILARNMIVYPAISLFLAWRWGKFKSGKHPWFFVHALFWFVPLPENNPRVPASHLREFVR